jgi:hypothetical protein
MSLIERKVMPPIFRARSAISPVIVNLFSLFVEKQLVVPEVPPSHMPMEILGFQVQCERVREQLSQRG